MSGWLINDPELPKTLPVVPQTVFVSIGNSDDKLTQREWFEFCNETIYVVTHYAIKYLGEWYSTPRAPWQNMCVAIDMDPMRVDEMAKQLDSLRVQYKQDSIALLPGTTRLIGVEQD